MIDKTENTLRTANEMHESALLLKHLTSRGVSNNIIAELERLLEKSPTEKIIVARALLLRKLLNSKMANGIAIPNSTIERLYTSFIAVSQLMKGKSSETLVNDFLRSYRDMGIINKEDENA